MNHNDANLKYDEAAVSFAATCMDLDERNGDYRKNMYGVINFAKETMDAIDTIVSRFVRENPYAERYIEKYGKDEFGAHLAVDMGGYGDGFMEKALTAAAGKLAKDAGVHSLEVCEGDDGWLHIYDMEAKA